jgi:hypothetical protein
VMVPRREAADWEKPVDDAPSMPKNRESVRDVQRRVFTDTPPSDLHL